MTRTFTKTRVAVGFLAALVSAGGGLIAGQAKTRPTTAPASAPATAPAKVDINVGRATTFILGPLNADGTVNYVAALNAQASKGVTPDNNAAVGLLRAIGPEMLAQKVRPQSFRALGIKPLPEKGAYFSSLEEHARPHEPKDPEKINAFRDKLYAALDAAMDGPWKTADHPIIASWLSANAEPLAQAVAASKRPRYYVPLLSPSDPPQMLDVVIPSVVRYRTLAKALTARAMLRLDSGDINGARADLLAVHRLGRLIGSGPTLIDRLIALAVDSLATQGDQALATSGKLSARELKAHLKDLTALRPLPGMAEAVNRSERFFGLDAVQLCARQGPAKALRDMAALQAPDDRKTSAKTFLTSLTTTSVDWNVVLVLMNHWYDRQVEAMTAKTFAQRQQAAEAFSRDLVRLKVETTDPKKLTLSIVAIQLLGGPKAARTERGRLVGNLLVSILMPTLARARVMEDRARMRGQLAELALALAAFKAERGAYPKALKELAPAYVKKIPEDLFINKPLHYAREGAGYCLYSVGSNMKDDGGKDDLEAGDHVVRAAR